MLVLSRKKGERLFIGESICVTVLDIKGGNVRLGLTAPIEVPIRREELPVDGRGCHCPQHVPADFHVSPAIELVV